MLVSINFHRGPGYSVDRSKEEPFNLWCDAEAREAFNFHWKHFAERYKGIPNREVSFNLLNAPATITSERTSIVSEETYVEVGQRRGISDHVGEFGAFNNTPHNVVLAWLRDMLSLWKEAGMLDVLKEF